MKVPRRMGLLYCWKKYTFNAASNIYSIIAVFNGLICISILIALVMLLCCKSFEITITSLKMTYGAIQSSYSSTEKKGKVVKLPHTTSTTELRRTGLTAIPVSQHKQRLNEWRKANQKFSLHIAQAPMPRSGPICISTRQEHARVPADRNCTWNRKTKKYVCKWSSGNWTVHEKVWRGRELNIRRKRLHQNLSKFIVFGCLRIMRRLRKEDRFG